jgi:hypothetical protein
MTTAACVFAAQFVYILLLGLQQQNVIGRHYVGAACTSLLLGTFGIYLTATIAIHAESSMFSPVWLAFIAAGPAGICVAMWLHPRIGRRKP